MYLIVLWLLKYLRRPTPQVQHQPIYTIPSRAEHKPFDQPGVAWFYSLFTIRDLDCNMIMSTIYT